VMNLYITRYLECFTCIYIAQLRLLRGPMEVPLLETR
jgi:hypothetical protein